MKFLLICVTFVAVVAARRQRCLPVDDVVTEEPINQCSRPFTHYETCGTACPETCENYGKPVPCTRQCVADCFCDEGYVLDSNKRCILLSECPKIQPVCAANEEYSDCGANGCQNTCDNPTLGQVCRAMCIPGCVCKEGYLRDADNNCVAKDSCPKKECSDPNASYTTCGTACPLNCNNYKDDILCIKRCVEGCFCNAGYVLDASGVCILPDQCPKVEPACAANEVYSECGNNSCQKNCDILYMNVACRPICTPGCICVEGYTRDSNGVCIPTDQCPKVCPDENKEFSECGANGCQNTCENPVLSTMCKATCIAGCVCKEGYLLDDSNNCILSQDCPIAP